MKKLIDEWKSNRIASASFHFDCGGDSMNQTHWSFTIIDDDGVERDGGSDFVGLPELEDMVYDVVEFYECSDGHYLGENGTVYVTLNDEGDDFDLQKNSMEHWSETLEVEERLDINPELGEFIYKNVNTMESNDAWSIGRGQDDVLINYKQDCIVTDKEIKMLLELSERLMKMTGCTMERAEEKFGDNYEEISYSENGDDRWRISNGDQEWKDGESKTELLVTFMNEFYTEKPSNDN